jgi:acetyl/propionyl-CoA carboxylase alpha subunit
VRLDSGIHEGSEVSLYYDPLLAKLIVWGNSREEAIGRMRGALRETRIVGIPTSLPFHTWIMDHEAFRSGDYDTSFLADGFSLPKSSGEQHRHLAAVVATLLSHERRQKAGVAATPCDDDDSDAPWKPGKGWRLAGRREAMGR